VNLRLVPQTIAAVAMATKLQLLVTEQDFCLQKLQITASLAHVALDISVVKDKKAESPTISPQQLFPALRTRFGVVSGSLAILRYLASLREDAELTGVNVFEQSSVDEWLEFSFTSIEANAKLFLGHSAKGATPEAEDGLKHASSSLLAQLVLVERHLASKTFLVGERLSIADISLVAAVNTVFSTLVHTPGKDTKLQHLTRWFMTVRHQPAVLAILGEIKMETKAAVSAPSSAPRDCLPSALTATDTFLPTSRFKRSRQRISDVFAAGESLIGQEIIVCGWSKTTREAAAGKLAFISLNDGTVFDSLQVVAERGKTTGFEQVAKAGGTHASFRITGNVVKSPGKGQTIEVHATALEVLGAITDPAEYPLPKGKHSIEYLRDILHLRPRSNIMSAVQRIRNACAFATHTFFQDRGFSYVHTPIITGSDCEVRLHPPGAYTLQSCVYVHVVTHLYVIAGCG
jgi:glutathione S-transferase